jgi:hypothetical protein
MMNVKLFLRLKVDIYYYTTMIIDINDTLSKIQITIIINKENNKNRKMIFTFVGSYKNTK